MSSGCSIRDSIPWGRAPCSVIPVVGNYKPHLIELRAEADFWALCWQSVDLYRFLTPAGQCRTLRCVVKRLNALNVGLTELADLSARMDLVRNVDWFQPCLPIARHFDWVRFERLGEIDEMIRLRRVYPSERTQCPGSTWYTAEGVHRTLVAAVLLAEGSIHWRPFMAAELQL